MNSNLNIFVSYTRRDGLVSKDFLQKLFGKLSNFSTPFIHALEPQELPFQEIRVLKALMKSHLVILIESPLIYRSPWVNLEILLSRLKLIPVIKISIVSFRNLNGLNKLSEEPDSSLKI
jgi:hypothetical protein